MNEDDEDGDVYDENVEDVEVEKLKDHG